jgi:hypothetical protein
LEQPSRRFAVTGEPAGERSVPVAPQQRSIVVVLGMHRSGTSVCARVLSALGVDMADDVGRGVGNDAGHWERWELVGLHDRLLSHFDRAYGGVGDYCPQHDLPLPQGWLAEPATTAARRDIEAFLCDRMRPTALFGFKDPRTCRFLPLWFQIFAKLSLKPKFVICVREPAEVALSLAKRDGIPERAGEYRWLVYNTACFRYVHDDYIVIDYSSWFRDGPATLKRLAGFVLPDGSDVVDADIAELIDPRLNHGGQAGVSSRRRLPTLFYEQIRRLESDPSVRPSVDKIVAAFHDFQQIIPFEEGFEAHKRRLGAKGGEGAGSAAFEQTPQSRAPDDRGDELAVARAALADARSGLTRLAAVESELERERARRRADEDRMRRLESLIETQEATSSNGTQRFEALMRRLTSLEAALKGKDAELARLKDNATKSGR